MAEGKGIRVQQQPVVTRSKTKACLAIPSEPNIEMCLPYEIQLIKRTGNGGMEDTTLAGSSTEQEEVKPAGREVADGITLDWSVQAFKDHLHSCITLQEYREKAKDINQSIIETAIFIAFIFKENLKCLYQEKTDVLEAQVQSLRKNLSEAQKNCEDLSGRLKHQQMLNEANSSSKVGGLCLKCAQHDAVLSQTHSNVHMQTIERLS
ncbi:UNVERIFIED_CONTAM: hypothetical protein K2H54_058372, partial [Gekko kuhli]